MNCKKIIMLICIITCTLFTVSGVFANDEYMLNETISENDSESQQLQLNGSNSELTQQETDERLSDSIIYFDASASSDGNGSLSNPYKYYKYNRVGHGTTAYFADGIYDIDWETSIDSSSAFIGQSMQNTILRSNFDYGFDLIVKPDSNLFLKNLTLINVHINNQANLVADNVIFRDGVGFDPEYQPPLDYSYVYQRYDSACGGVIICDTPFDKTTTLNLNDCYFINNNASSGGAIATYNTVANINHCLFYDSSSTRFGGAIYSLRSILNVSNSYFELSKARYGGAIYANLSEVNLENSIFNISQAYSFGGVVAFISSQLDVNNTLFVEYASLTDAGGAIYAFKGVLNVASSSFWNGHSDFGGAICNLKSNSSISYAEFINNDATYYGGTIYNMYGNTLVDGNVFINSHAICNGAAIFDRMTDSFHLSNNRFSNATAIYGPIIFVDGDKYRIDGSGNLYDGNLTFLEFGSIYDIDYYEAVPLFNYTAYSPVSLPSSYDSRAYGYVTSVKDQVEGGNCWAFAGIATLEACIKKATGIDYDFSEENVKNIMAQYSLFGSDDEISSGGNLYMFIAYMASWFGPTSEENDVYDDFSSLSVIYNSLFHIQNVYVLPERQNSSDNDWIKRAVMEYGAVAIGIDSEAHAVTIVGWDDKYRGDDFLGNRANGAWIIKNSWGSEWEDGGFGYLSYEESISSPYTFIFNDVRGYTDVYQYDYAGKSGSYWLEDCNEVYLKNRFVADNDEILSAVSTYFDEPTDFTVYVYINDELVSSQNGSAEMGYYTIPLIKELVLNKGDKFDIVVKFSNPAPVYFPLCAIDEKNKIMFDRNISFLSTDGKYWTDLYDMNLPGVLCIKAFTRSKTVVEVPMVVNKFDSVYVDDRVSIQVSLPVGYFLDGRSHYLDGLVTFTINGQYYYARVFDGQACLNISFDSQGTYELTAQYKSNREISNVTRFTFNVVENPRSKISIRAENVSKFYGGPENYTAVVTDNGVALSGVNVRITVNGKTYTRTTDINGRAVLALDNLKVGDYDVVAEYEDKSCSSIFSVVSTINAGDVNGVYLNTYVSALFLDSNGNALSKREVIFSIGNLEFKEITDKNGFARSKIDVGIGNYNLAVSNPQTGEKKQLTLNIYKATPVVSIKNAQDGNIVTLTASLNYAISTGNVVFAVGERRIVSPIDGGRAVITLDDLQEGSYVAYANYTGDNNFNDVVSSSITFRFVPVTIRLSAPDLTKYYGGSENFTVYLTEDDRPIMGAVVKLLFMDDTYDLITDDNGMAFAIINLNPGSYFFQTSYADKTVISNITIKSTIDVSDLTYEYLNSKVTATFHDVNGSLAGNMNVAFIVNGKEYGATTGFDGVATSKVDLPADNYIAMVENPINNEVRYFNLTIEKATPDLDLSIAEKAAYDVLTASLPDDATGTNHFVFDNGVEYTLGINEGRSIVEISTPGTFKVNVAYSGDNNYNPVSKSITIKVVDRSPKLSVSALTKVYGDSKKLTVRILDYKGKPLTSKSVSFTVYYNNKKYKSFSSKTDSKGYIKLSCNYVPRTYSVEMKVDKVKSKVKLVVKKATPKLTASKKTFKLKTKTKKYTITLKNNNGKVMKNKKVTIKVKGKTYSAKTNSKGKATFKITKLAKKGKFTATVKYAGSSYYNSVTKKVKITVKK